MLASYLHEHRGLTTRVRSASTKLTSRGSLAELLPRTTADLMNCSPLADSARAPRSLQPLPTNLPQFYATELLLLWLCSGMLPGFVN